MKVDIKNISKSLRDKEAVSNVSVKLKPGIWGLLGANGAGKTTLMRMIVGIMEPSAGTITCEGIDISKMGGRYRERIGYLPQEFGYDHGMTVNDYLEYIAALKGVEKNKVRKKISELLDILSLSDVRKKKISKLSGGMKRRVGVAQALLNDPELLIMDEPTAGLDPGERVKLRNYISEIAHDRIVIISTHIVSDIEYIASQIMVMKNGSIINIGSVPELEKSIDGKVWTANVERKRIPKLEMELSIVSQREEKDGLISIRYLADETKVENSIKATPNLEDMYLWLFPMESEGCVG